jgi:dephospho-CoA kinase
MPQQWKLEVPVSMTQEHELHIYKNPPPSLRNATCWNIRRHLRISTFEEIEYLMEWEKMQKAKGLDDGCRQADLITEIETIVEGAKSKTNKELLVSAESDAQRKKNIRQNRQVEKEINREIEAFELDRQLNNKNAEIISFSDVEEELPSNPLDLLRRKQREAFGKINE